jgi:hypothetical protein
MRGDIIRMAREAGINLPDTYQSKGGSMNGDDDTMCYRSELEAAVKAEREACAQVAEDMLRFYTQAVTGVPQAIRARGQA